MSKCNRCDVYVVDVTDKCPLCQHILVDDGREKYNTYPDARIAVRRFRLIENILLFASIVAAVAVLTVDYMVNSHFNWWSLLVVLLLVYANAIVRVAIFGRSGYIFKTVCLVIFGLIILGGIDYISGAYGWSYTYAYPAIVALMVITIVILMIINKRNWQSYMMLQIFTILLSIIPVIFVLLGKTDFDYFALGAFALAVFLFLGTLIIGDKRARTELIRRFHI